MEEGRNFTWLFLHIDPQPVKVYQIRITDIFKNFIDFINETHVKHGIKIITCETGI